MQTEVTNEQLVNRLANLTSKMDVPEFRKTSIRWLQRNLAIRNSNHKFFKEANEIVDTLARKGIQ